MPCGCVLLTFALSLDIIRGQSTDPIFLRKEEKMGIVDIVLIVVWIGIVIFNFSRGFIKALKPFRKWLAFLIAISFCGAVFELLITAPLVCTVRESIYNALYDTFSGSLSGLEELTSNAALEAMDIPVLSLFLPDLAASVESSISGGAEAVTAAAADTATGALVNIAVRAVAFLLLFLISFIVLSLVLKLLDVVAGILLGGALNRIIGGLLGVISGYVIVWLLSLIAACFVNGKFIDWMVYNTFLSGLFGLTA